MLGTNPWGLAVPREGHDPIVLDMALTQSGKGMMRWLAREKRPMPDDWALTPDGQRTTDPEEAAEGPLLPIGSYKGYGLSLFTDILTGVLTGSLFGADVFQDETNFDVAHSMIAIDIEAFMPSATFQARLAVLVDQVMAARPIDPARPIQLPGAAEQNRARDRRVHGIPLHHDLYEELQVIAAEHDIPFLLEKIDG